MHIHVHVALSLKHDNESVLLYKVDNVFDTVGNRLPTFILDPVVLNKI